MIDMVPKHEKKEEIRLWINFRHPTRKAIVFDLHLYKAPGGMDAKANQSDCSI